jgi:hypothetical protein
MVGYPTSGSGHDQFEKSGVLTFSTIHSFLHWIPQVSIPQTWESKPGLARTKLTAGS